LRQTAFDKHAKYADLRRWLALPVLEHGTAYQCCPNGVGQIDFKAKKAIQK
jgi:hypothetical protein